MTLLRRLNWGCGLKALPGWVNSDIGAGPGVDVVCDILEGLPLDDNSFDYVVSIHALPEISCVQQEDALWELRRVLKPGGVLRLGLPDLNRAIQAYQKGDRGYFLIPDDTCQSLGGKMVTQLLWYGRSRCMFTMDFMAELLQRTGFRQWRECAYRQTCSPFAEIVALDDREPETLFVEAVK